MNGYCLVPVIGIQSWGGQVEQDCTTVVVNVVLQVWLLLSRTVTTYVVAPSALKVVANLQAATQNKVQRVCLREPCPVNRGLERGYVSHNQSE